MSMLKVFVALAGILLLCQVACSQPDKNVILARKQAGRAFWMINSVVGRDQVEIITSSKLHDVSISSRTYDYRRSYSRGYSQNYSSFNGGGNFNPPIAFASGGSMLDQAIVLLQDCQKLDPESINYPFEIGFAYYIDRRYKKSLKYLERLQFHKDVTPIVYQLLVKTYLLSKDEKSALRALDRAFEIFPNAGNLYQQKGMYFLDKKDTANAMYWFLQGVRADPIREGCYYQAFLIQHARREFAKCQVTGEMFLNLEPSGPRYREVSRMMFHVSSELFGFRDTLAVAAGGPDLPNKLDRFCKYLINNGITETGYPGYDSLSSSLVKYRKNLLEAGQMESYLHWLFQFGDQPGFQVWNATEPDKWRAFVDYFRNDKTLVLRQ